MSSELLICAVGWICGILLSLYHQNRNRKKPEPSTIVLNLFSPSTFSCRKCLNAKKILCTTREKCAYVAFSNVVAIIESSTKTIDVCSALLTNKLLADVLKEAHVRGIRVRIITDNNLCTSGTNGLAIYLELTGAGISMVRFVQAGIMHHKFIVLDKKILLLGTMSWTASGFFGNYEHLEVTDDPDLVSAFSTEFESLWSQVKD